MLLKQWASYHSEDSHIHGTLSIVLTKWRAVNSWFLVYSSLQSANFGKLLLGFKRLGSSGFLSLWQLFGCRKSGEERQHLSLLKNYICTSRLNQLVVSLPNIIWKAVSSWMTSGVGACLQVSLVFYALCLWLLLTRSVGSLQDCRTNGWSVR